MTGDAFRFRLPALGCCLLIAASFAAAGALPTPRVPFLPKPVETVCAAHELRADAVVSGTKSLQLRESDQSVVLAAGAERLASFRFRVTPSEPGWQPFAHFTRSGSVESGRIVRECPFGLTKTAKGVFRQGLSVADGRARLASQWTCDEPSALKGQIIEFAIPFEVAVGRKLSFADEKGNCREYRFPAAEEWGDRTGKLWVNSFCANRPTALTWDAEHPERSYRMDFAPGALRRIIVFRSTAGAVLHFETDASWLGRPLPFFIDLGASAKPAFGDYEAWGINFTQNDDSELALYDLEGNILPNPSFESRSRYWHDVASSSLTDNLVTNIAHSGRYGLLLGGANSFCFPTLPGKTYTVSFYARSVDGTGGNVRVMMRNYVFRGGLKREKLFHLKANADWQRFEWTFDWPNRGTALCFSTWTPGKVVIDDVQFELGERATAYRGNPYGLTLETDSPDGCFADATQPFNPRLRLTGPADANGTFTVDVEDFFGAKTHRGEGTFALDADGSFVVSLCPDAVFEAKGVHSITLNIRPKNGRAFRDHFRLARFAYQDGTCPKRVYHQVHGVNWGGLTNTQTLHRVSALGICSRYDSVDSYGGYVPQEKGEAIRRQFSAYGHLNVQWVFSRHFKETLVKHGIATNELPQAVRHFTPEYLAKLEEAVADQVARAPECRLWIGPNEVGQSWAVTKANDYEEYAKAMMAVHRGVKRVNAENRFAVYSVCNLGEQGRREIHDFLAAGLRVDPEFRFDGVDVHPYRPHPEYPDLDADFKELFGDLDRLGYGEALAWGLEGGYFYPLCVAEWQGIAPWQDTLTKDGFALMHRPSYDLGWGEKMSAAMLLRYNLICYKYAPRLAAATCWGIRDADSYNPVAAFVATSAQQSLLGRSSFQAESRFAPGARAYLYDDGEGRTVAAVWTFDTSLDYGRAAGETMTLGWTGSDIEIFDMMGNRAETKADGGVLRLPLSNFPFYLRVPAAKGDALLEAINSCETTGRQDVSLGFDVKPLSLEKIRVTVVNPLSRAFKGSLSFFGSAQEHAVEIAARASRTFELDLPQPLDFAQENEVLLPIVVRRGETSVEKTYRYRILPVGRTVGRPDWSKIPSVALKHRALESETKRLCGKWNGAGDLSGSYRAAWGEEGLYLHFEVTDDVFANLLERRFGVSQWYDNDSIQLFFDTLGDAPTKAMNGLTGMDDNDMSYELLPSNATTCVVYRRQVPDHQLTGGVEDGLRKNMVEPAVKVDFTWDEARKVRTYDVFFPARYLMPIAFKPGSMPGLGIKVYDRDDLGRSAKQTLTNVPLGGGDVMNAPHQFTTLLFCEPEGDGR